MWWVIGLVAVVLLVWGLISARQALYPEGDPVVELQPPAPHAVQTLRAPDGASFEVWRLAPAARRGRVLIVHGYYASRAQVIGIAGGLQARGYEGLVMELRGHGSRPGPCTFGVKEAEDGLAVLAWARQGDHGPAVPTAALGLSMGAAVACLVARGSREVRAVVADSVYARFYPIVRLNIRRSYHLPACPWAWMTWATLSLTLGRRLRWVDPIVVAPHLQQPALFIHGGGDAVVPAEDGETVRHRWAGRTERWWEPGVVHVGMFARSPETYCDRVAAFLQGALG